MLLHPDLATELVRQHRRDLGRTAERHRQYVAGRSGSERSRRLRLARRRQVLPPRGADRLTMTAT
jgi:hypothetical protein